MLGLTADKSMANPKQLLDEESQWHCFAKTKMQLEFSVE